MSPLIAKKPNWILLAAIALFGVTVFQSRALLVNLNSFNVDTDIVWMRQGYELARSQGTARWWVGGWIHTWADFYYRPLISYFHYFQFWMLDRTPFWVTTAISMLIYSAVVFLAAALAFRLTARPWAAYVTAFFLAVLPLDCGAIWLAYFPYADSLFCLLFQLTALLCFFQFLTDQRHRWLIVTWCAFLASGLCKEQGWITPLLMGGIVLLFPLGQRLKLIYYSHVVFLCLAAGVMLKYARTVTHAKDAQLHWPIQNIWISEMLSGNWWLVLIGFSIMAAAVAAVVYRNHLSTPARRLAALGVLACFISLLLLSSPPNGLAPGVYASIYIIDHALALATGAGSLMLYAVAGWLVFRFRDRRAVVLLLCTTAAMLPIYMVGVPLWSARALLFLPFFVPLLCEGVAVLAIISKNIRSNSIQIRSSRLRSAATTSVESAAP
jgi:hypothetical protein